MEEDLKKLDINNTPANQGEQVSQEPPNEEQKTEEHQEVQELPREWRYAYIRPKEPILDDKGIRTHSSMRNNPRNLALLSQLEPKYFQEVESDKS